jgi:hypothetical protein
MTTLFAVVATAFTTSPRQQIKKTSLDVHLPPFSVFLLSVVFKLFILALKELAGGANFNDIKRSS